MKKLTLALDQLEVDTFVAGPAGISPGTVRGNDTQLQPFPEEDAVAPAPVSWNTQCATLCFTCDRSCPSNVSGCYTGSAPNCCV
jgi:hypothetical protein